MNISGLKKTHEEQIREHYREKKKISPNDKESMQRWHIAWWRLMGAPGIADAIEQKALREGIISTKKMDDAIVKEAEEYLSILKTQRIVLNNAIDNVKEYLLTLRINR